MKILIIEKKKTVRLWYIIKLDDQKLDICSFEITSKSFICSEQYNIIQDKN